MLIFFYIQDDPNTYLNNYDGPHKLHILETLTLSHPLFNYYLTSRLLTNILQAVIVGTTDIYRNSLLVLPSWICSISRGQQNCDYPLHILLLFISFLFACIYPHQAITYDEYIKLCKIDLGTRKHAYTHTHTRLLISFGKTQNLTNVMPKTYNKFPDLILPNTSYTCYKSPATFFSTQFSPRLKYSFLSSHWLFQVDRQIKFKVFRKVNLNITSFEPKDAVKGRASFTVLGQQSIRMYTCPVLRSAFKGRHNKQRPVELDIHHAVMTYAVSNIYAAHYTRTASDNTCSVYRSLEVQHFVC
jgi:hypothetical protein